MNPLHQAWKSEQAAEARKQLVQHTPNEPQPWHALRNHGGVEAFAERQRQRQVAAGWIKEDHR